MRLFFSFFFKTKLFKVWKYPQKGTESYPTHPKKFPAVKFVLKTYVKQEFKWSRNSSMESTVGSDW